MSLIYLGQTFAFAARPAQSNGRPLAVNWRYQIHGETYGSDPIPMRVSKTPKAINWRWQAVLTA